MNWFTWVLLVVIIVAVLATAYGFLRPSTRGVDPHAKLAERNQGAGDLRGGIPNGPNSDGNTHGSL